MPEGPEIRRSADEVEKAIIGLPVRRYGLLFHLCSTMKEVLTGARIKKE